MVPEGGGCVSVWGGTNILSCAPASPIRSPGFSSPILPLPFCTSQASQLTPGLLFLGGKPWVPLGALPAPGTVVAQPKCDSCRRILELEGGKEVPGSCLASLPSSVDSRGTVPGAGVGLDKSCFSLLHLSLWCPSPQRQLRALKFPWGGGSDVPAPQ